jgi:serine/threonine-protein kinase RsbW
MKEGDSVTIWLNTSFRTRFRVIDRLQARAERVLRELLVTSEIVRKRTTATAVPSARPAGLRSWGHVYAGRPELLQRVRADLKAVLSRCPIADETILVASELAANAITHSGSRQPGGRFIVRADVCPGDYVWVEVQDQGDVWADQGPPDDRPHGLDIVRAIAGEGNWGIEGDTALGRVAWARLDWPGR